MNRLGGEDSPYLKQHEHNPVHWQPWGEEALAKAKEERKPIFISIGYSTCHWCHVMEREVFEQEEFAKTLNENFISIKIDREERPDIDKYYQEIYQILNKRAGGWPLSMFLTHEGKPFFAGTYIPPKPAHGMIGFNELLQLILEKYETNYEDIVKTGESLTNFMSAKKETGDLPLDSQLEEKIKDYLVGAYDEINGGFSEAPKFPHSDLLNFALTSKDLLLKNMAKETLLKMSRGGLYDLVEGGFCRYSVDEEWLVPHFEKMLYDNALLIETNAKAYDEFKEEKFRNVAITSADFFLRKMSEDNLFYSASDADTEGEEGKYFVYGYGELLENGLSKEKLQQIGVTKEGNFEGKNIIRSENIDGNALEILQSIRDKREYPFIDRKIVVFQNAMMIKALFYLSKIDAKYKDKALSSLDTLLKEFSGDLKRSKIGKNSPKIDGFLEDYAYLIDALLVASSFCDDEKYLTKAQEYFAKAREKFFEDGIWYFSKGDFPTVADPYDNSYPSAVGVMVGNIQKLALLDNSLTEILENTINGVKEKISRVPFASTTFVNNITKPHLKISANKEQKEKLLRELKLTELDTLLITNINSKKIELCNQTSCFLSTANPQEILERVRSENE